LVFEVFDLADLFVGELVGQVAPGGRVVVGGHG
jgi:hypothetical protein